MPGLRVVVCGDESAELYQVACALQQAGLEVRISTLVTDCLCQPGLTWDLLLIDMDSLTSFLRGLLPAVRRRFPKLSMIGLVEYLNPDQASLAIDFGLDSYLPKSIEPDQLPQIFQYLANSLTSVVPPTIPDTVTFVN